MKAKFVSTFPLPHAVVTVLLCCLVTGTLSQAVSETHKQTAAESYSSQRFRTAGNIQYWNCGLPHNTARVTCDVALSVQARPA